MKTILLLILTSIFMLNSCSKDEPLVRLTDFKTPVITDLIMRDVTNTTICTIGVPNIKLRSDVNPLHSFSSFPNPCRQFISIYVGTLSKKKDLVGGVSDFICWMVKADYVGVETINPLVLGNAVMRANGHPVAEYRINGNMASIDVSQFETGYYRLYVKIGTDILYDNILINN